MQGLSVSYEITGGPSAVARPSNWSFDPKSRFLCELRKAGIAFRSYEDTGTELVFDWAAHSASKRARS